MDKWSKVEASFCRRGTFIFVQAYLATRKLLVGALTFDSTHWEAEVEGWRGNPTLKTTGWPVIRQADQASEIKSSNVKPPVVQILVSQVRALAALD